MKIFFSPSLFSQVPPDQDNTVSQQMAENPSHCLSKPCVPNTMLGIRDMSEQIKCVMLVREGLRP